MKLFQIEFVVFSFPSCASRMATPLRQHTHTLKKTTCSIVYCVQKCAFKITRKLELKRMNNKCLWLNHSLFFSHSRSPCNTFYRRQSTSAYIATILFKFELKSWMTGKYLVPHTLECIGTFFLCLYICSEIIIIKQQKLGELISFWHVLFISQSIRMYVSFALARLHSWWSLHQATCTCIALYRVSVFIIIIIYRTFSVP